MCLVTGKKSIQQEALASCPWAPPQGPVTQAPPPLQLWGRHTSQTSLWGPPGPRRAQ